MPLWHIEHFDISKMASKMEANYKWKYCVMRKICLSNPFSFLNCMLWSWNLIRHLACNQIKRRKRMRQFITKYIRKYSLRLVSSKNLHSNFYFTDFWTTNIILVTSKWCYFKYVIQNLIYSRWRPGWYPTSFTTLWERHPTCRHVWLICNRPGTLLDRAALSKHA